MNSIRRALLGYFLLLLVLALGASSALSYRTTSEALLAKAQTDREAAAATFDERQQRVRQKLDEQLETHARQVAKLAEFHSWSDRERVRLAHATMQAGLFCSLQPIPNGYALVPVWLSYTNPRSQLAYRIASRLQIKIAAEIHVPEDTLPTSPTGHEFLYQVNGEWGQSWYSHSLGTVRLPTDGATLTNSGLFESLFDELTVPGLGQIRRVVLKAPVSWYRRLPPRIVEGERPPGERPVRPEQLPPGELPPRPPDGALFPSQTIIVQCACSTQQRTLALEQIAAERERHLLWLDAQRDVALADLRGRLLWLVGLTFAGATVGVWLLVGVGLAPLRRLTEAVSQVSEKDFRLPLENQQLPTELRPIAERLTQTLDQLRRAFQREKQATADISHELRTPLAALQTTLDVALRKPRAASAYEETLRECREIARQLGQMVERILTLARLDAGTAPAQTQAGDLGELARDCLTVVRPLAEVEGLAIALEAPMPVIVTTDRGKLREVVTNLLHNAIAYNRPGGSVTLAVHPQPAGAVVEVRDTGIGIAPELHERIFERFFRADPARHEAGVHAGLGLAIVREYVTLLGGTIAVKSVPGQGSTFRVELPTKLDAGRM